MICNRCEKPIDVAVQLKEADDAFYDGISGPIMLMIECHNCEEQTAMLEITPLSGETEEIESPLGPVKFPKL